MEDGETPYLLVSLPSIMVLSTRVNLSANTGRDAFTTSGDFIISPHSASKGLFIATCGNFHGWKFFPVLGKYVVQMIEGELEDQLAEKWSWDREWPHPSGFADYPRFEMKDLMDNSAQAKL